MSKSMAKVPDGCRRSILRSYSGTTVSSFAASRSVFRRSWRQTAAWTNSNFRLEHDAWLTVSENTCERDELDLWLVFFLQRKKIIWKGKPPKVKRYEDDGAEFLRTVLDGIQEKKRPSDQALKLKGRDIEGCLFTKHMRLPSWWEAFPCVILGKYQAWL